MKQPFRLWQTPSPSVVLRGLWAALWLLCVVLPAHPAHAQSGLPDPESGQVQVERAVWADPTGEATLEEAMAQTFTPAPTIVSRGYKTGATWLRVTVPATPAPNLWATIQPLYLDDIQLYSREWQPDGTQGVWTLRQEGDQFPFSSKERRTLLFSLALDTSPTEPTVFYVRLRTQSTHALFVNVRTQSSALNFEGNTLLGLGLYLGVVLVLVWMSLVRLATTRDGLWALNTLFQGVTVVHTLVYLGLFAKHVMPNAPQGVDLWVSSWFCLHLFAGVLYYWRFAVAFQAPRWARWCYAAILVALPFQLWLIWHGQTRTAMALNSNLLLYSTVLGAVMNWHVKIADTRLKWMVRFTYTTQTVYLAVFILPILGVGQMTLLHLYPALLVNLFASVMQHMVLARRDQLELLAKRRLELEVESAQLQLQAKQWQLAESTSFLGMLLHELKNPLASVRLAALNMLRQCDQMPPEHTTRLVHIQTAVEGMDAVLERCRQVDRLETGAWQSAALPTDVADLVMNLIQQQPEQERIHVALPSQLLARLEPDFFQTMVSNLLDNALGYSPPKSPVHVSLQDMPASGVRPRHLMLTVRNTLGKAGLPDPKRLFEKYYRAQGAHQRTGSGLGLYLVKSLAERAQGGIGHRAEKNTDVGGESHTCVVFELWLPCR